jgi:uncharacterized protein YndB with AHSA1/START domain
MSVDDADRFGTIHHLPDGRVQVRFERRLPHSVETVWAALTEQEQLDAWMPGVRFEAREGGTYEIWFGGECEGPAHVSGLVAAYQPPNVLQLGTIRWELSATEDGCLLKFSDVLVFEGPRSRGDISNAVLGGWHHYLDRLEEALAGRPVQHDQPEPDYAAREVPGRPE